MNATNAELIAEHYIPGPNATEHAVNAACKAVLRAAGVRRVGQTVEVLKGRHRGLQKPIETINWTEAEVRLEGCPRWFSLWHDRNYFRVVAS